MKGNGAGTGNGSGIGSEGSVTLVDLKAAIAALKVLKREKPAADYEFELSRGAKRFDIPKSKLRSWVDEDDEEQPDAEALALSIEGAQAFIDGLKPDLVIDRGNLPAAAYAIRDAFRAAGNIYERGVPVGVAPDEHDGLPQIVPLAVENIILEVHERFRPVVKKRERRRIWTEPAKLPDRVARLYLAMKGKWGLPRFEGITTAPVLTDDGGFRTADGYDRASGLWCAKIPAVSVPERPSEAEAREALHTLRRAFRTFPFADAPRRVEQMTDAKGELIDVGVVDLEQPPGRDESTLLTTQVGAVCRPSLHLAPGILINAARSGSGSGKGLLLRGVSMIAFGVLPWTFTKGGDKRNPEEIEKRISAALLEAHPSLLLDNVNNHVLLSETLESALTERPCHTRPFGKLQLVELYSTALIGVTGNGLTPGRDLVRKIIVATLDALTEVPALRKFALKDQAWLAHIKAHRGALLSAVLTIWRFGRQREQAGRLKAGEEYGSYDQWCRWARDPLLALGCQDPIGRIHELRAADPARENLAEIYGAWWEHHQDRWVSPSSSRRPAGVEALASAVRELADRENRGPQHLRSFLNGLDNDRTAGFVFERYQDHNHPTMPSTYRLIRVTTGGVES